MKRLFAFFLALVLLIGAVPAMPVYATEAEELPAAEPAFTEPTEPDIAEPEVTEPEVTEPELTVMEQTVIVDTDLPGNDDLFAGYVEQVFYGESSGFGTAAGRRLSGNTKLLYDALVPFLRQIAAGQRASTVIGLGEQLTVDGVTYPSDAAVSFTEGDVDFNALIGALLTDFPYELYWYDKTAGCSVLSAGFETPTYIQLSFSVAGNYAAGAYQTDTEITSAAAAAVVNAQDILANNVSKSDFEKLTAYKDAICQLVSYESNYGDYTTDNDPWQLIHVFDGDSSTNVVCEGYSKAFMYLCDKSSFSGDITCITVSGDMGGSHMWNIVRIGEDSYHVDVTNSEPGTVGQSGNLFLAGGAGSPAEGYTVGGYAYTYDEDTTSLWGTDADSILTLAEEGYDPNGVEADTSVVPEGLAYTVGTDSVTVTGYSGSIAELTIPATIEGKPVTAVADAAFRRNTTLLSVTLPDSVTTIGNGTFFQATALKSVKLPAGITEIGNSVFSGCSALEMITIPEKVTAIRTEAFYGCTSLTSVEFPASVTTLGNMAFQGCSALVSVSLNRGLLTIGDSAFHSCTSLRTIAVFDSTTLIDKYAFYGCTGLQEVSIGGGTTEIGQYAFKDCTALHTLALSEGLLTVGDHAFENCIALSEATLPSTVTHVGSYAFNGCSSMTKLYLGSGVQTIDTCAFSDCTKLSVLTIPDSVTTLGEMAFSGCESLECLYLGSGLTTLPQLAFANCAELKVLYIPASITEVGALAISPADKLWHVIYSGTLAQWESLRETLSLSSGITYHAEAAADVITTPDRVDCQGKVLYHCTICDDSLRSETVTGDHSFENGSCTVCGAADDSIPEPPQSIGEGLAWALDESGTLTVSGTGTMADFQEGLTPWQSRVDEITSVKLEKGVANVGAYAFAGCVNLTEVILPDTVTEIGAYAFSGSCLQTVFFCGTQIQWSAVGYGSGNTELDAAAVQYHKYGQWIPYQSGTCIEPAVEQCLCELCGHADTRAAEYGDHAYVDDVCIHCGTLYIPVPEGLTYTVSNDEVTLTGYTGTDPELIIPSEIEGKPVTAIADAAFRSNLTITFVSLPNTVTAIGDEAFGGCRNLADIAIPEGVKSIGDHAFSNCALTSVWLPDSLTSLGRGAFSNCKALELAVLGSGIQKIDLWTFENCSNLRCFAITASTTQINGAAFKGCTALECCSYLGDYDQFSGLRVSNSDNDALYEISYYLEGTCCPPEVKMSSDAATGKPKLVWSKEACAIGYAIFRCDSEDGEYEYLDVTEETSYVDTSVQAGQKFYYIVVGISPYGNPGFDSNVVSSSSKCAAPILTASNKASSGKPVISWEAVYGAAKYEVYRATSKSGKYTKVKTTTATSYTDTDASVGKTYYYKVKTLASSSKNNSGYSDVVSQLCICAQPATTLSTASATGKPVISWKKVSGASKYEVYRSFAQDGEFELIATTAELSYTDKTAPADTDCWYKVNAIASSAARNSIDADAKLVHATIARPDVTAKPDDATGKPVLSWETVEGATGYKVYRATKSSGTYTELAATEELTYTDTAATRGKTYYYKVKALNATCASANSTVDSCASRNAAPVLTVTPKASTGKPVVKWEKVSGAKKYEVYRATTETGKYTKVKTTTATSYTDTKATAGKTYYYKVRALASSSTYKSAYSTIVPGLTVCAQPSVSLSVASATGKPVISWKKVSGASGYEVYRSDAQDGTYELLTTTTAHSYSDETAAVDTAYWYKVNALAANTACNSMDGTPKTVRATIAKPVVTAKPDDATGKPVLSWEAVEGAATYKVYRASKKSGTYKAVATVTDPTYTDTKATRGKTYYYKVKAYGENCTGAYSSIDSCAARNLQPTVTVAASESSGKPVISWNKVSGTKNYQIYRSTAPDGTFTKLKTTTSRSFTDKTAAVGVTYYYKVRSVASSSAYTGAFSQPEACLCVCARPSVTVAVDSASGKPSLSWKAVSGAAGYQVYRMDAQGNEELVAQQTAITFLDAAAAPDSDYSYKVNALGASPELNSADGSYKAVHTTLAKPVVTAKPDDATGKPVLTWDAVEGAATYKVYRATKKSGNYKAVATVTDPTYTDAKATRGKTYYYKVRAYAENSKSAYSSIDSCASRNAQPVVIVTANEDGRPVLTWTKVSGTKNYQVYRSTAPDGDFTKVKTTTSLKFTDTAPEAGVTYYYKVRSVASSSTYTGAFSQVIGFPQV